MENENYNLDSLILEIAKTSLSKVKLAILKALWNGGWIDRQEIFNLTKQTYYDRRIRELKESGWQIETHSSGRKYRLISHIKNDGKERTYPDAKLKKAVFEKCKGICQLCRSENNPQYDHKIPLLRNGETTLENLQLLCSTCNVEKRGACKNCTLTSCDECGYAFPEKFNASISVFLDEESYQNLIAEAKLKKVNPNIVVKEIVQNYYKVK